MTEHGDSTVRLRSARFTDAEAVIAFDPVATSSRQRVNFIHQAITSRHAMVAETNGQVVAFGVLDYSFFDCGFVKLLVVEESRRRQGIGSALVEAMVRGCKTDKVFSSTNESNAAMQALLEKAGFVRSGRVDNLDADDPELIYFRAANSR